MENDFPGSINKYLLIIYYVIDIRQILAHTLANRSDGSLPDGEHFGRGAHMQVHTRCVPTVASAR